MAEGSMRFRLPGLLGLAFVRRPVSDAPADGTVCFVDDGHGTGWDRRPTPAIFKDGAWKGVGGRSLPFEPTYWTTTEDRDGR